MSNVFSSMSDVIKANNFDQAWNQLCILIDVMNCDWRVIVGRVLASPAICGDWHTVHWFQAETYLSLVFIQMFDIDCECTVIDQAPETWVFNNRNRLQVDNDKFYNFPDLFIVLCIFLECNATHDYCYFSSLHKASFCTFKHDLPFFSYRLRMHWLLVCVLCSTQENILY